MTLASTTTKLIVGHRGEVSDYQRTGYDREHIAPAVAMKWSKEAMSECFFMTNMTPQVGTKFNRRVGTATPDPREAHHTSSRVERRHLSSDSERFQVANLETGQTLRGAVDQLLIGGDQYR